MFRYYCPYGPEDLRFNPKHKKSKKRGCLARFAIRQLKLYPHIGEVIYYHNEHTRENGEIAHGALDPDSIARRSGVAPRISGDLKNWIIKRLDDGLTARQVFEEHKKIWYEGRIQKKNHSKDNSLLLKNIRYYEHERKKGIWYRHKNVLLSVNFWRLENSHTIFFYQDSDAGRGVPFTIGIQTLWQKDTVLKYGKNSCISMDATFGTNDLMYHLFTLVVSNEWHNGIPIAWILTSRQKEDDIYDWLLALKIRLTNDDPTWKPSCVIVDDAVQERMAIK